MVAKFLFIFCTAAVLLQFLFSIKSSPSVVHQAQRSCTITKKLIENLMTKHYGKAHFKSGYIKNEATGLAKGLKNQRDAINVIVLAIYKAGSSYDTAYGVGSRTEMSFENKVVIVTGGGSGIGAAVAVAFAKESARVVIIGRNEANLKTVAQTCDQYTKSFVIKADLTKDEEIKMLVEKTVEKFGKIDVLVNNAGIMKPGELLKGDALEVYDDIFKINLRAAVSISTLAAPYLVKTKGNIVNMSSILATGLVQKRFDFTTYGMSKAALNYFTQGSALELSTYGVRVNSVSPGPTKTGIFDATGMDCDWDEWGKATALGKCGEREEVAELVLYVASDKAKSVTGSDYTIDNGLSLH